MDDKQLFDLVYDIGETLLQNGGEMDRTEETIARIAHVFGLQEFSSFVMVNAVFISAKTKTGYLQAKVKEVEIAPMSLSRIDAINTLSRDLESGRSNPIEAKARLEMIKSKTETNRQVQLLAYTLSGGSFAIIFGGALPDTLPALMAGLLLGIFMLYIVPRTHLNKILINVMGSALVALFSVLVIHFFPVFNLNPVITGGVVALFPGVALVNGFRCMLTDDYESGMVRLMDALMTALCIAVGVGVVIKMASLLMGGF